MADNAVVHIGENSPEEVAFKLMNLIMNIENRHGYGHGDNPVDREWIIRTYAQCIAVVNREGADHVVTLYKPDVPTRRR